MKGISVDDIMSSIIPITRFNRGEASKIFDEVSESGVKVVLKNNAPACVLVDPEQYDEMVEALEDYALYFEAQSREKSTQTATVSEADVLSELGITESEIDEADDE